MSATFSHTFSHSVPLDAYLRLLVERNPGPGGGAAVENIRLFQPAIGDLLAEQLGRAGEVPVDATETWAGGADGVSGHFGARTAAGEASVDGDVEIRPDDGGTRLAVTGTVSVAGWEGGAVERVLMKRIADVVADEHAAIIERIDRPFH